MAGMKDLSTAFAQAAGPHVSLRGQRMRYDSERNHVLEFDAVCGERGDQGFVEKLTSTASMVDLTAAAIRLGTRARELAHGGEQLVMKTPVDHAVERIKSGEFELVDDGQPEPKPALFF